MNLTSNSRLAGDTLRPRIRDYGGTKLASGFVRTIRALQVSGLYFFLTLPLLVVADGLTSSGLAQDRIAADHPQLAAAISNRTLSPTPQNLDEVKRRIGYPAIAAQAGQSGTVVAEMLVDETGHVVRWRVEGNVHASLKSAVAEQLPALLFTPGTRSGKPVRLWVSVDFVFRMN
jgi:Gram-negative bacterial TonB protein C-terminal